MNDDVETNDLVLDGAGRSHLRSRFVTMETKLCIPAFTVVYCIARHGDDACVDEIGVNERYLGTTATMRDGHRIQRYSASLANAIDTAARSSVLATRVDHS